jgi:hypothetical protein
MTWSWIGASAPFEAPLRGAPQDEAVFPMPSRTLMPSLPFLILRCFAQQSLEGR